jgi:hypothetical protein
MCCLTTHQFVGTIVNNSHVHQNTRLDGNPHARHSRIRSNILNARYDETRHADARSRPKRATVTQLPHPESLNRAEA